MSFNLQCRLYFLVKRESIDGVFQNRKLYFFQSILDECSFGTKVFKEKAMEAETCISCNEYIHIHCAVTLNKVSVSPLFA